MQERSQLLHVQNNEVEKKNEQIEQAKVVREEIARALKLTRKALISRDGL